MIIDDLVTGFLLILFSSSEVFEIKVSANIMKIAPIRWCTKTESAYIPHECNKLPIFRTSEIKNARRLQKLPP